MPRSVKEIMAQADELAKVFEEYDPDHEEAERGKSLAAVHRASLARARSEADLAEAIARARANGHSWTSIGRLVGTSGEAVRQRYGPQAS